MMWQEKIHHPHDVYINHYQEIKERWGRDKELSITSLPNLDNKIWGLRKRNLVVVAGRPSQGKSNICLQWALDFAKQGKKVQFFTLEMTPESCIERIIARECSIDNFLLRSGKIGMLESHYIDKLNKLNELLKKIKLTFISSWGKSFAEINQIISSFETPDVVVIDYVNMIKSDANKKRHAISEYIKNLRTMAIEKNFCAIIACQINREAHKNKDNQVRVPNLWHLKEAGELEEHCDQAFIVHYDYFYSNIPDEEGRYIIKVAKNREGRTGEFECFFEPQFNRVSEYETEN